MRPRFISTRASQTGGRRPGRAGGFTLIEILIAIAILVIGMVGVLAGFSAAVGLHKRGMDQTTAALLAQTILEIKQREALDGKSCDEMSTRRGGDYVFRRSEMYPAYECKIICTELSDREYQMSVEVRMRPRNPRDTPSTGTEAQEENVRFETILLR
jgi:prepilin-type N-terminal cleavage/methylation domain-containing protein